jgi:hypothetical protein
MARSKQEIISEMVDSGLFSDDEIRQAASQNKSMAGKAWDALAWPEKKSREGLQMIAQTIPQGTPTGNLPLDVLKGTPRIAADTLAEAAPGFVSRGSILTAGGAKAAGALAPVAKTMLRAIGKQGESVSGAVPGSLEAAYNDAGLIAGKGKKAVSEMYEKAKELSGGMRKDLQTISDRREFVDKALKLSDEGNLNPLEALEARKELVKIKKQLPNSYFQYAKDKFNSVAKQVFGESDEAYQRANMAESLRNIVPQNKYGGTSAFKMGIQSLASTGGIPGKLTALAISPFAQGVAATGAGLASRNILAPLVAGGIRGVANPMALYTTLKGKQKQ